MSSRILAISLFLVESNTIAGFFPWNLIPPRLHLMMFLFCLFTHVFFSKICSRTKINRLYTVLLQRWYISFIKIQNRSYLIESVKIYMCLNKTNTFKWLAASDVIRRHRIWSTLFQVMACWLTAPSHYPNQYWLIILRNSPRVILLQPLKMSIIRIYCTIVHLKSLP